jgi:hypothetical protein
MNTQILTENFYEPLNEATTANIDIHASDSNLTIDRLSANEQLPGGEQLLTSGTLQYFESQDLPTRRLESENGLATLTLRGSRARQPRFRFPWSACNGATEWQIHLNPAVPSDIIAYSGGGNVKLDLAGMAVTHLSADTGGGNVDVVLPDNAANLNVTARTGAGKVNIEIGRGITGNNSINASSGAGEVVVGIPSGVQARIHVTTGLGKAIVDPQFSGIDKHTYQSSDFESAANTVEITAKSGAGNVIINTK